MHAKPLPEIQPADLDAVRRFLTADRDEDRPARIPASSPSHRNPGPKLAPVIRNGITRARSRAAAGRDDA